MRVRSVFDQAPAFFRSRPGREDFGSTCWAMENPVGEAAHFGVSAVAGVVSDAFRERAYLAEGFEHSAPEEGSA